jgi:hypothetical protein
MNNIDELLARNKKRTTLLLNKFFKDYADLMKQYTPEMKIEITRHLLYVFDLYCDEPEGWCDIISNAELAMFEKFGEKLQSYDNKGFLNYFDVETVLIEKGIFTAGEWEQLPPENKDIDLLNGMMNIFKVYVSSGLSKALKFFYLRRNPDDLENSYSKILLKGAMPGLEEGIKSVEVTKARQLLTIYFLLKASGIEHRVDTSVSAVARLIHVITCTPFTTIQNSDIYKKYREMPHYKKGKELLADLNYIRPFFEAVNLDNVLELVDTTISAIKKDQPV